MHIVIYSGHRTGMVVAYSPSEGGKRSLVSMPCDHLNIHGSPGLQGASIISNAVRSVLSLTKRAELTSEDRLVLVIPGISSLHDLTTCQDFVRQSEWPSNSFNFSVIDDTYAGLVAGGLSTKGISVISGMGSSVFIGAPDETPLPFTPGKPRKLDGWGPFLGDHGSAFRLSLSCLETLCRQIDEPIQQANSESGLSPFYMTVLQQIVEPAGSNGFRGLQNVIDDLSAHRSPEWRFKVSELSELILKCSDAADTDALELVNACARNLAQTVSLGLSVFDEMYSASIYCHGRMLSSPSYMREFQDHLHSTFSHPGVSVSLADYSPVLGGLLVSMAADWTYPNRDLIDDLVAELERTDVVTKRRLTSYLELD